MNKHITCIVCLSIICLVEPYKILGLFPFPGSSHYVMFEALLKALAEKGHEVDVLSHFPQNEPLLRFNDLSMKGSLPILRNNVPVSFIREQFKNRIDMLSFMIEHAGIDFCEKTFNTTVVQELKNTKKKYDLVITEIYSNDCMLGFGYHFKVPVISMTSSVNIPWGSDRFGNPDNPSYIPNYFVSARGHFSLMQRLENTLILLVSKFWFSRSQSKATEIARKFFGPHLPDLNELAFNTSLLLVNSHFSTNNARPTVPNFIEVGGLHVTSTKPLPKNFEDILNITTSNKYRGIIYLSMGSMVLTETFPEDKLLVLFNAFSELPYKILWKATKEKMPKGLKVPSNIHFESWIPQSDVLCHPNVKLFITHGGLMGSQEAIFCGIPSLGIPLFADQEANVREMEANGFALTLSYDKLTKQDILWTAKELLSNSKYKENAEIAARRFKDRPLSPLDTAIYWVEYVIRHHGASHLRSTGTDLPWYKYHLLDVAGIFLFSCFILIYITYKIILSVFYFYAYVSNKSQKTKRD